MSQLVNLEAQDEEGLLSAENMVFKAQIQLELLQIFSDEELYQYKRSNTNWRYQPMEHNKAPGPDGIPAEFY